MPKRKRTMKGGFMEGLTNWASSTWETAKNKSSNMYNSLSGQPSSDSTSYTPAPAPMPAPVSTGGRKTKRRRGGKRKSSRRNRH